MSSFFSQAVTTQSLKRSQRLTAISDRAANTLQTLLAVPTGINPETGVFISTTPDGSEVQYSAGNFRSPPSVISLSVAKSTQIGFGDWQ